MGTACSQIKTNGIHSHQRWAPPFRRHFSAVRPTSLPRDPGKGIVAHGSEGKNGPGRKDTTWIGSLDNLDVLLGLVIIVHKGYMILRYIVQYHLYIYIHTIYYMFISLFNIIVTTVQ